jgi:hypothetical protein
VDTKNGVKLLFRIVFVIFLALVFVPVSTATPAFSEHHEKHCPDKDEPDYV